MEIEQTFEIPSSADRVWRWFNDIEAVVGCLPGASLRAPPDDGKLQLSMSVKLGPIAANFVGDGEVHLDDARRSGKVTGGAIDRKSGSRIKGQVAFALDEHPGPDASQPPMTRVTLAIDYTIGGTLAQFSREGIVRDLARRLTDTFATNLRHKLEADEEAMQTAAPAQAAPGAMKPAAPARAAPLNFGALLWAALKERVSRLLHRRPQA